MLGSVIGVKLVSESESESFMHVVVVVVCCCWSVCVGRDTLHTLDHSCVVINTLLSLCLSIH